MILTLARATLVRHRIRTLLAILGTFTSHHLGMHLDTPVNLFHWSLVFPAWAIGLYGLWRERHPR